MKDHITGFPGVLEGEKIMVAWKQAILHHLKPSTQPIGNVDSTIHVTKKSNKKIKNHDTYQVVLFRTDLNKRKSKFRPKINGKNKPRMNGGHWIPTLLKHRDNRKIVHEYQDCVYMIGSSATGLIITGVGAFILPHMTVGVAVNTYFLQSNIRQLRKVVKKAKKIGVPLGQVNTSFAIIAGALTKLAFVAVTFGHDDFLTIAQGYDAIFSHFGHALEVLHPHVVAAIEQAQQWQSGWVNEPSEDQVRKGEIRGKDDVKKVIKWSKKKALKFRKMAWQKRS